MPDPDGEGTRRTKIDFSAWIRRTLAPYTGMWVVYGVVVLVMAAVILWFAL